MSNKLTTISNVTELKALQNLYLTDWPKHCVAFFWLENYLRWLMQHKQIKYLTFYTLNGDWQTDGLLILVHRYQLYFSNLSQQKASALLTALSLLNWQNGYKVSAIHELHFTIFKQFAEERELHLEREMKTVMYRLSCDKAKELTLSCPRGYYLASVQLKHAELINDHWPARHMGSLKLIEMLIENNPNVGLYDLNTDELCGWCLRLQSGFLGALQVKANYQRRGLATTIVAALAKRISTVLQQDVTALVAMDNTTASKVFHKLNFKLINDDRYCWCMCVPRQGDTVKWPSNE